MTSRIRAPLAASALCLTLALGLVSAAIVMTDATPAHAQYQGRGDYNRHREGHRPPPRQYQYDWRSRQPDMYYGAPPIIYAPPGYYQQPGATLSFSFPFYR